MDKQLSPVGSPDRQRQSQHKIIMRSAPGAKGPTAAIGDSGAKILQLGAQGWSIGQLLLDLQPAIMQEGLHLTDEDQLRYVVNTTLVDELVIAGGDRDLYRVQAIAAEQIGDRAAHAGQVEHQLRAATKRLLEKEATGMLDDARIGRVERQPLQITTLENRLGAVLNPPDRGKSGRVD